MSGARWALASCLVGAIAMGCGDDREPAERIERTEATASPLTWVQRAGLVGSASVSGIDAGFGKSVGVSGSSIVVGAMGDDPAATDEGAAYVFVASGTNWVQQQKLLTPPPGSNDQFGSSVAIDGDTVAVGAHFDDATHTNQGRVHVFTRSGTTWSLQQSLVASDPVNNAGLGAWDMGVSGNSLVALTETGSNAAYVFVRSGSTWSQQQKISPPGGQLARAVSISGDTLVLGVPYATVGGNGFQGTAHVYVRSGGVWSLQQTLVAADGAANDWFGFDVDVDGDTLAVACPYSDVSGVTNRGAVYVWVRSGSTWSLQQKVLSSDNMDNADFGYSVAVDANRLVSQEMPGGASGALFVFNRSGSTWSEQQKISGYLADTLDVDGEVIVTGNGTGDGSGAVYVQLGASCSADGQCGSGYCRDGVCCETDCPGECTMCAQSLGASADGFCTTLPVGSTPAGCASPRACNGGATACAATCANDLDCAASFYCSPSGACLARKAQGQACDLAMGADCKMSNCRACQSNFCRDGYCCSADCGSACDVCSLALGASANGACSVAPAGTNITSAPNCLSPQACNGSSLNCPSGCTSDLDCASTHYCNQAGSCVVRLTQGSSCNQAAGVQCQQAGCRLCASGNCVDGYCCDTTCNGTCSRCDAPGFFGACKALADGAAPDAPGCSGLLCDGSLLGCPASCAGNADCASTHYCDGGQCLLKACTSDANCAASYYCANDNQCTPRKAQGAVCNPQSGADCAVTGCRVCQSSNCVDGYCCNTACTSQCASCGLPGKLGTCSATADGTTPDTPGCSGYLCDGTNLGCAATCATGGDCAPTHYCSGNACLPSGCGSDNDCSSDRYCDKNGICQLRKAQGLACNAASGSDCMVGGCRVCQSNNCVDGYCCGTTCTEPCGSCGLPTKEGTCSALADNAPPDAPGCNGYLCGGSAITCPATCANDTDCATTHYCAGGQCLLEACGSDTDCAAAYYCGSDGNCKPRKITGNACSLAAGGADCKLAGCRVCQSNNCVDGYCCDTACTSQCASCGLNGKQGTCSALADGSAPESPGCSGYLCNGTSQTCVSSCASGADCAATHYCSGSTCMPLGCGSDTDCAADRYCDKNGTCQLRKGQGLACNAASGADCMVGGCRVCQSNNCVDGFCCGTTCTEPCGSCGLPTKEGTCSALADNATPDAPGCSGYLCGGAAISCPSTCINDSDCASTHYCSGGQCWAKACATDVDCAPAYFCAADSSCKPRKSTGAACSLAASADCKQAGCRVCQSNYCVDGYCCDSACGEPCATCAASTPGVCSALPDGTTPEGPCSGYLCDGSAKACATGCSTNADCASTHYCSGGACVLKKGAGESCTASSQCGDPSFTHCADGVCCNTTCTGTCMACAAANKQSGANGGTCEAAKQGTNPNNGCIASTDACGEKASCSGVAGQCAKAPYGTTCGPTSCASATTVSGKICDGTGTCIDQTNAQCAPYLCKAGACASPCAADGDCASGNYCSNGTCVAQSDNGKACTLANHCKSGFCVDGVCCDAPCGGQCQACAEPGTLGQCKTVGGTPRGTRPDCSGTSPCKGTCDGANPTACTYPSSSTSCAAAKCTGDVSQVAGSCDGAGGCTVPPTANCAPYGCEPTSGTCKTSCAGNGDCAQGALCDTTTGKCAPASATCKDAFTVSLPNGQTQSCTPYKCLGGACQQQCSSSGDCAPGHVCEGNACVLSDAGTDSGTGGAAGSGTGGSPAGGGTGASGGSGGSDGGGATGGSKPPAADDGGCGCRVANESSGQSSRAWLVSAALLLVLRRRRARGCSRPRPACPRE